MPNRITIEIAGFKAKYVITEERKTLELPLDVHLDESKGSHGEIHIRDIDVLTEMLSRAVFELHDLFNDLRNQYES
jgi:hypothetical protein